MLKNCPRCHAAFDCRNDNVIECACMYVPLSSEDRNFIGENYDDCLCGNCLVALKKERQQLLRNTAIPKTITQPLTS